MRQQLKTILRVAIAVAVSCSAIFANAATYPSRPLTVIVPYAPGGNLDVITRVVTQEMAKELGQPIVVDNRPGAGGQLGLGQAANAKADGYTLVAAANGGFAFTPRLMNSDAYAPEDFAPVGMMGITPLVFAVPAESKFQTFDDLKAYVEQNPEGVLMGHAGNGTTNHIAILLLQQALDIKFTVVPYSGSAPALNDLLGQHIDVIVDQIPSSLPHLQANALRALAVTSTERATDLPDVPTLQEVGVADFEVVTASGILVPAGVNPEHVQTLSAALNTALNSTTVRERLSSLGTEIKPSTPSEFGTFMFGEVRKAEDLDRQGLLRAAQ